MTTPGGLLMWGQAGDYDAIEDRSVIAVLAQGRTGLVFAPTLTALPGLVVGIGPWAGIADCEDRTSAIIGSRDLQQVNIAAGGATARTDLIWADIDPDGGTWEGHVIAPGQDSGRAGLLLGTVLVPAGANNSSVMDLIPARSRRFGGNEPATINPGTSATGTAYVSLASATIPAGDAALGSVYELEVWGNGTQAQGNRQDLGLRIRLAGQEMSGLGITANSFANNQNAWRWHLTGRWIRRDDNWQSFLEYTISVHGGGFPGSNPLQSGGNVQSGVACESTGFLNADPTSDLAVDLQARFGGTGGNPTMVPRISTFKKIAG